MRLVYTFPMFLPFSPYLRSASARSILVDALRLPLWFALFPN